VEIGLSFLGPFHDLRIHLLYTGVIAYSFIKPAHSQSPMSGKRWHSDLWTHEIRLTPEGRLAHEMLFVSDATFLIECSDIRHSEELLAT
jgi:hypothetical protein